MFKVLSIDGGGIRGIIAALFLAEIEKRTGKPIAELFDLLAGTSTGGILALGFALPDANRNPKYTAMEGVELYEKHGQEVFPVMDGGVLSRLRTALLDERYRSDGLINVLKNHFGKARLGDVLVPVIVPTYDLATRQPRFFKSNRDEDKVFHMWQVALATSVAPTYFEPYYSAEPPPSEGVLIDGGVFANSPAMCAYADATHMAAGGTDDILLVSVGTGYATEPYTYEQVKDWGQIQWVQPIIGIFFDAMGASVDYQLEQLLPRKNGKQCYYRFQVKLSKDYDSMDDASPKSIKKFKEYADWMINEANERGTLAQLCAQLVE